MAEDKTTVTREDVDLDAPLTVQGGYQESPDHKPNPFYQYGTLDTTDLSGGHPSEQMSQLSPVFAEARAQNLAVAARALDPNDPTPSELVVLPQSTVTVQGADRTAEDAKSNLYGTVKRLQEEPLVVGGISASAAQAALGTAPEDVDDETTDEDRDRQAFKEETQATSEERVAALRETPTTTGTAPSGTDSNAPVAGSSPTPSATPPKEDEAAKQEESKSDSKSGTTSTARKSSTTSAKSNPSK